MEANHRLWIEGAAIRGIAVTSTTLYHRTMNKSFVHSPQEVTVLPDMTCFSGMVERLLKNHRKPMCLPTLKCTYFDASLSVYPLFLHLHTP